MLSGGSASAHLYASSFALKSRGSQLSAAVPAQTAKSLFSHRSA